MRIYRRIGVQPVRGALTDRLEAYPTGKNLSATRLNGQRSFDFFFELW